jgi:amidase
MCVCVDDPAECEGMPTHVQIMGMPMMDEELLQIMHLIDELLLVNGREE